MQPTSLDDYSDLTVEAEFPGWTAYSARAADQTPCRLIVFTPEVSANQDFRAAWRHDTELLRRQPHDGLPRLRATGDCDGVVYVATEPLAGRTVEECLTQDPLAWDEIADLGWQAASVLQHLHNFGIVHGGIDDHSFRVSDQLRVTLLDAGVSRWVQAASDLSAANDFSTLYRNDLLSLGRLMEQLAASGAGGTDQSEIPEKWWSLISDLSDASADLFPSTAREVQGRLGGVLLEDSGESMDVVADRTSPGRGDRSIVDELLDTPLEDTPASSADDRGSDRHLNRIILSAILLLGIVVILLLLWR